MGLKTRPAPPRPPSNCGLGMCFEVEFVGLTSGPARSEERPNLELTQPMDRSSHGLIINSGKRRHVFPEQLQFGTDGTL